MGDPVHSTGTVSTSNAYEALTTLDHGSSSQIEPTAGHVPRVDSWRKPKLAGVVAFDLENYVRSFRYNVDVQSIASIPAHEVKVLESLTWQLRTVYFVRAKAEGTELQEWDLVLFTLSDMFGASEEPLFNSMETRLPTCWGIRQELRRKVSADIRGLQSYQDSLSKQHSGTGGERLSQENVHVILVGDERPLEGEGLQKRLEHQRETLRKLVGSGLITEEELSDFLSSEETREARERFLQPRRQQWRKSRAEGMLTEEKESELLSLDELAWEAQEAPSEEKLRELRSLTESVLGSASEDESSSDSDSDYTADFHRLWPDTFWSDVAKEVEALSSGSIVDVIRQLPGDRLTEMLDTMDPFTLKAILPLAVEHARRLHAKSLGHVYSRPGVKADVIIAELARRLNPRTLVIVSNDTDFIQAWHYPSFLAQLRVSGRQMRGTDYDLEPDDWRLPMRFAFKCALLGKRHDRRREQLGRCAWSVVNALGGWGHVPAGLSAAYKDALGPFRYPGDTWKTRETDPESKSLFEEFAARAQETKVWRNGLGEILTWLEQFVPRARGVRCRFLSNVLAYNIIANPDTTRGPQLHIYEQESEESGVSLAYDVQADVDAMICEQDAEGRDVLEPLRSSML